MVIISPSDTDLITEGSEMRRKFIDGVISQLDSNYLQKSFNTKTVSQRNALLKYFALNHVFETETLSIYNSQLDELGNDIFEKEKVSRRILPNIQQLSSNNNQRNRKRSISLSK